MQSNMINSRSLFFQVGDLLGKYPDLMEGFNEFLIQSEKNGNFQTNLLLPMKLNFLIYF